MREKIVELTVTEYDEVDYPKDELWLREMGYPPTNLRWKESGCEWKGWFRGTTPDLTGGGTLIIAQPALATNHYIKPDQIVWKAEGLELTPAPTILMRF